MAVTHLIHAIYNKATRTRITHIGGKKNKISPSREGGKYLTSRTSMLSKSIVIRLDLDLLLNLVNLKASTILECKEDEKMWRGGCGGGDPWGGNFINGRLQGVVSTSIGSTLGGVGVPAFQKEKCNVSKRSITGETSSSKLESKIMIFSLGSIYTLENIGTWTVDVQKNKIVCKQKKMDDWTCE